MNLNEHRDSWRKYSYKNGSVERLAEAHELRVREVHLARTSQCEVHLLESRISMHKLRVSTLLRLLSHPLLMIQIHWVLKNFQLNFNFLEAGWIF